jgi:hypothetical protein
MGKYDNEEVKSTLGGSFTPAPAGNHMGVCVGVAIIGTIDQEYEGHVSRKKMVRLYFELSNTLNSDDDDKPFIVGKDFLNSLNAKANLRKLLDGWRGSKMSNQEAEAFNLVKLLDHQCLINVAIKDSEKGGQYNDILNVSPIPDGVPVPVQKTESFLFNFNPPFKQAEFERLEKFVQDKIKTSDEYLALSGGATVATTAAAPVASVPAGKKPF